MTNTAVIGENPDDRKLHWEIVYTENVLFLSTYMYIHACMCVYMCVYKYILNREKVLCYKNLEKILGMASWHSELGHGLA